MTDIWIIEPPARQGVEVPGRAVSALLASAERRHACALAEPERGDQYCAFRIAMRAILKRSGAALEPAIPFQRHAHGKPYLPDGPQFSFSATRGLALLAVSQAGPVGVDIERIRDIASAEAALKRSPALLAMADQQAARARNPTIAFLRAWTRLEASLKFDGLPLAPALSDLDLSSWKTAMQHGDATGGNDPTRALSAIEDIHGYVASCAHLGADPLAIARFDWVAWVKDFS